MTHDELKECKLPSALGRKSDENKYTVSQIQKICYKIKKN